VALWVVSQLLLLFTITEKEAYEIILNIFKEENIELDTINCPEIKFILQPNGQRG
jgi:hypothetical protein